MNPNKQFRAERALPSPQPASASPRVPVGDAGSKPKDAPANEPGKGEKKVVREQPSMPTLRFSPLAWAKLVWFCLHGDTEISGFAITDPLDSLYVTEFVTVRQQADWASISLDDAAVADFFDQQVDAGHKPEQFARIWLHTHPGDSPHPSGTDDETFNRVFGRCQWAVLFVLARTGKTYARLRFNVGPGGQMEIPVRVDWLRAFAQADHDAWAKEYQANIQVGLSSHLLRSAGSVWDERDFGLTTQTQESPAKPFGSQEMAVYGGEDVDEEWLDLLCISDQQGVDEAAEKVCIRWGLTDFNDWGEAVMSLSPAEQRQFRKEVEAILDRQPEVIHEDY